MVMFMEETYLSQHQSLVQVEAEVPLLQEVSVPAAAEFMVKMFAQLGILSVSVVTRRDILRQCATHPGGHSHSHIHLHLCNNIRLCKKYTPMMTRTLVTKQKMLT